MRCRPLPWVALLALSVQINAAQPAKPVRQSATPPPCCVAPASVQPALPDTRGTPEHPLIIDAIPVKTPADIAHEDDDRAERRSATDWAEGIGIATIVILLVQAIFFAIQAHHLNQSVKAMQGATEATKEVATAETATVETMNATARRELKAYLFIELARVDQLAPNNRAEAKVTFKNYGKTPAYKVKLTLDCGRAASFEDLPKPERITDDLGTLGPGAVFTAKSDPDAAPVLSEQDYQALVAGTQTLFVYGEVQYQDTFGDKNRFQKFRLMLGGGLGLRGGLLALCKKGNETDEPD